MEGSSQLQVSYSSLGFKNITINHAPDTTSGPVKVVVVRLNRPEKLNAVTEDMLTELEKAYILFEKDPQVQAVVLTGAGKAFCAGADLSVGFSELFSQKESEERRRNFKDQ
jgi:enoyl-CoA hydratase/carnithine racemase